MFATLLSAATTCLLAVAIGQLVLRVSGLRAWSWQSGAVGLSLMMLLAAPAIHLPGRGYTVAVIYALLLIAALVLFVREPAARPPWIGALAAVPVALLTLVPFVSAGRFGTLGISFSNDMSAHLIEVEAYRWGAVEAVNGISEAYPLGPHAVVSVIANAFGLPSDYAFAGLIVAIPILIGWAALGALHRRPGPLSGPVVATLTAMTFLSAAFYVQAAFKEIILALLLVALASMLGPGGRSDARLRWLPAALVLGGTVSVYSASGLLWPGAILVVWVAGLAVMRRRDLRAAAFDAVRAEWLGILVAVGAVLVLLIPQIPRTARFVLSITGLDGPGLAAGSLGNLVGPLPFWEVFGIWQNADFRLPPADPLTNGVWAAFVLLLAVHGIVWFTRRGDWGLPAAAIGAFLAWVVLERTQSPYNASKGLVVLAPLIALVAVVPLVDWARDVARRPRWVRVAATAVTLVLAFQVLDSSWSALRTSFVGPRDHTQELRSLRTLLDDRRTLFLGNDDFIRWQLSGVPVDGPVIVSPRMELRPQKAWEAGDAIDVDTIDASILNQYDWVVTPRDAAGSAMPPELELVRTTRNYAVYARHGEVPPREVLEEVDGTAAALLRCDTPAGRALLEAGGVASVRSAPVAVFVPALAAGTSTRVELPLRAGTWELQMPYTSQVPIEVTAPGLDTTLAANQDRPGNRWPVGRITVDRDGPVPVELRAVDHALSPSSTAAIPNALIATRVGDQRTVPLRRACGRWVDWYRLGRG